MTLNFKNLNVASLDYTTVPSSGDGHDILIVKVLNNIDGYPDPNNLGYITI